MRRILTDTDIHNLLEKAESGVGPSELARDFGVSRQSVQYQLRKHDVHLTPFYSGPPAGQTLYLTGTFWLYYNTNRGRPRTGVTERPAPWVLRTFKEPPDMMPFDTENRPDILAICAICPHTFADHNIYCAKCPQRQHEFMVKASPNYIPEGKEMLVNEVKLINGSALTRYEPNPIWINKRGDHIRYVRGFLVMQGVVEVKT